MLAEGNCEVRFKFARALRAPAFYAGRSSITAPAHFKR